jgi:3-oxoacyl-[acyl-carrier-protein] synthase III
MGTIIKSVAFFKPFLRKGIVSMTAHAAKQCLKYAGNGPENLELLINTAVYSENHLSEPALSALILNKIFRTSKTKAPLFQNRRLFSFDLHNGGGGAMNAIQVIDGFLQTGQIESGMVVAGDAKPNRGRTENFKYVNGAAAILLVKDREDKGFVKFSSDTYPDYENDNKSMIDWGTGRFMFLNSQDNHFLKHCLECAEKSIRKFLKTLHLETGQLDLILTSQTPRGFGPGLQKMLFPERKMFFEGLHGEIYSAGLFFAMDRAFKSGEFMNARNILLVTVGAGITVSLSLYINS